MKSLLFVGSLLLAATATSNASILANFIVPDSGSSLVLLALGALGLVAASKAISRK